ncbi:MAG TPA: hypothetical protein PK400_03580 [Phycisphaerales bacterium]|nr:hypothetical protein [Phycisphaerales bacterium]HRQ75524.1 hypothetical protein [Phycisphaerales bacterium]
MDFLMSLIAENFLTSLLGFCVLVIIILRTAHNSTQVMSRERTRREIAAYIAEGSMRPEQGERLLRAAACSSPVCP